MEDIIIRNITKSYGDKRVLSDLKLTLEAGNRYALVAPSGTGKTTLLRILLGLEKADCGEILGMPDKVAVVFQEDRLCEGFTALENVTLVMNQKLSSKEKKKLATSLIEELDLTDAIHKKASKLSGGMKRRLSLARALAYDSELLILDEPFEGLDVETRRKVIAVVERHLNGRTLIMVSHNKDDIVALDALAIEL